MAKNKSTHKKSKGTKATPQAGGFGAFVRSEQFARLRGAVYVMLSLFLVAAIVSYFVSNCTSNNWLGSIGYHSAEFFAKNLFGIGSLGFGLLLFVYGLRLWKVEILPWWKTFWCTLFWMVWLSTTLGYICGTWVKDDYNRNIFEDYAGLGVIFAGELNRLIHWGTLVVMVFIAGVFLVFVHKVSFDLPKIEHKANSNDDEPLPQASTEEASNDAEPPSDDFADFENLLKAKPASKNPLAEAAPRKEEPTADEPVADSPKQEAPQATETPLRTSERKEKKPALDPDLEPQLIDRSDPTKPHKVVKFAQAATEAVAGLNAATAMNAANAGLEAAAGLSTAADLSQAAAPAESTPADEGAEYEGESAFNVDDEFERVMQRARGLTDSQTSGSSDSRTSGSSDSRMDEASEAAKNEPEFTILETEACANGVATTPLPQEPAAKADEPAEEERPERPHEHHGLDELYDPHLDLRDYEMPSTDLLENWEKRNTMVTKDELIANKDRIVSTLRDYGIEIVEISASPGPTVTLYEIKPAPGIRISKIKNLEDDIALSLSAMGIRIIAPIPGKGTVGIEVPNTNPQIVSMKTMLESDAFKNNTKMELPIAFGKTISNDPFITDLAKMPHLLMAGATGTGKSVGLNAVIASLLYKKHPSELKFVMVDPKKVELSIYNKIERHYLAKLPDSDEAIITDVKKVVRTLNSLCIEMDQRYDLLKAAGVRKITEYNDKFIHRHLNPLTEVTPGNCHRFLPYIVLIVDEFADLIMTAGKEVETPICRLAQLARAVGIHLIIATQRPTTNIITGTIKANFPARVAFKVTSAIDSRTILDAGGAQRLIGRGDMLISLSGSDLVRLQCALMETEECEKLSHFIGEQRGYLDGFLLPEYLDENEEPNKDFDPKQKDEFFNDAAHLVVQSQFGSTSLLQRKLGLGYNRAGRVIDQLEAAGIVGPHNGSKPRDVLIHDEMALEEILKSL